MFGLGENKRLLKEVKDLWVGLELETTYSYGILYHRRKARFRGGKYPTQYHQVR